MDQLNISDIEGVLGFRFYDWQKKAILSKASVIVLCCGRKSGKTQTEAAKIVLDAAANPGIRILITAKTETAAKELFMYVNQIIRLLKIDTEIELRLTTVLTNGSRIECMTTGPTGFSLRPRSYYRMYIAEAGFMADDVYDAISPCLAVKGTQRVFDSSPWDTSGFFYDAFGDPDSDVYHVSSEACPHIPKEFLQKERRRMGKEVYAREYLAEFMRATDSLIKDPVIYAAVDEKMDPVQTEKDAPVHFVGVDFARFGRDDSAIVWAGYFPELKITKVYRAELLDSRARLTSIVGRLVAIAQDARVQKIVTDETGIGGGPTDALIEKLGKGRVVGVSNQKRNNEFHRKLLKQDLYTTMICAMEEGRLKIFDDQKTIQSLRNLRYKYTSDADLQIFGREDHIAEALVRAVWLPLSGQAKDQGPVWVMRL